MNISKIQFGLCSSIEIERRSVVEIEYSEHFDDNGNVKYGGLFDPRMGCTEPGKLCVTCNENNVNCNGHFGFLKLSVPVFHVAYLNEITKIMRCFCFNCNRLLVRDPKKLNYVLSLPNKCRLDKMYKYSLNEKKCIGVPLRDPGNDENEDDNDNDRDICGMISNSTCSSTSGRKRKRNSKEKRADCKRAKVLHSGCEKSQPSYKRYELYDFYAEWSDSNTANLVLGERTTIPQFCDRKVHISGNGKVQLGVLHIKDFFARINEDDLAYIGFSESSKPEWIILSNIFVAPPVVRPTPGLSFDTNAAVSVSHCVSDKWYTICEEIVSRYSNLELKKNFFEEKIKRYFAEIKDNDCSDFFRRNNIVFPNLTQLESFIKDFNNELTVDKIMFPAKESEKKLFWKNSHLCKLVIESLLKWNFVPDVVKKTRSKLFSYKSPDDVNAKDLLEYSKVYELYEFLKSSEAKAKEIYGSAITQCDESMDTSNEESDCEKKCSSLLVNSAKLNSIADEISKTNSHSGNAFVDHSDLKYNKNFTVHHNDLTLLYTNIIKVNNEIKISNYNNTEYSIKCKQLQTLIFYLMGSDVGGKLNSRQNSFLSMNKQLKCLKDRIQGKDGRIRGNLMGKRVDFSARSVITADPNLKIREVGIPIAIAKDLTIPEVVNKLNKNRLTNIVNNRVGEYPNANYLIKKRNKRRIDLRKEKFEEIVLENGDIVGRQLVNGDPVVFNRQPTLHKMSMMGHIARVLPWSTFRLNLSCTTPYNADFDGDEMNLHVPQSLMAQAEVRELLLSSRHLVTPQSSKPVMGIVQDALTGVFKFTSRGVFLDEEEAQNLCMYVPNFKTLPPPCILKPKKLWSGKQILSLLIPEKLFLMKNLSKYADPWICNRDRNVIIENGQLLSGSLCKQILGTTVGSLLHICFLDFGHEVCENFYNNVQCLINVWIQQAGHTVGISDLILKDYNEIGANIGVAVREAMQISVDKMVTLDNKENKINNVLNTAVGNCGKIARQNAHYRNNIKCMIDSGSKGSEINLSQMTACVGQQNVNGLRIPFTFQYRSLPHYCKFENSVESRGFVSNSYYQGLNPIEFFFHAMGGREGLIDTAIKTAISGYIQRRVMKSMESLRINYDKTVRNCNNEVYQFRYGDDGFAGEYIESVDMKECLKGMKKILSKYKSKPYYTDEVKEIEKYYDSLYRLSLNKINGNVKNVECDIIKEAKLPINIPRTVLVLFGKRQTTNRRDVNLLKKSSRRTNFDSMTNNCLVLQVENDTFFFPSPHFVREKYRELKDTVASRDEKKFLGENVVLLAYLTYHLSWKRLVLDLNLNLEQIAILFTKVRECIALAEIQPGEMVGSLAAQSVGEPTTQMTLNTFHHAGVSAKNVTLGVPRLDEILNVTSKPKSPSSVIYLNSNYANKFSVDKHKLVNKAIWDIKFTTIEHLRRYSAIVYCGNCDNNENWIRFVSRYAKPSTATVKNKSSSSRVNANNSNNNNEEKKCCWFLEIVFDANKLDEAGIEVRDIAEKIWENYCNILVIYVRDLKLFITVDEKELCNQYELDSRFMKELEEKWILPMNVSGIENIKDITRVTYEDEKYNNAICIETTGSNFAQLLCNPKVDYRRSYTNDICQIYSVLGIEAARSAIEREVYFIFKMYDVEVNYRHLSLLCDTITNKGSLMPINRHGINRQNTGPLLRCSFEETVDILQKAALYSETDDIKGVSESIIVGKVPELGTGCFDVLSPCSTEKSSTLNRSKDLFDETFNLYANSPSYQARSPEYAFPVNEDEEENIVHTVLTVLPSAFVISLVTYKDYFLSR